MHEYSIVQSLIATCARVAREHGAEKIVKIHVTVGKLSGIEPHFLEQAYQFFREGTVCEHADMVLELENIVARCQRCDRNFQVDGYVFICPECSSGDMDIIRGKTLQITHVELTGKRRFIDE
ncbi:hydrogenase maturation nickel metallochaperone HypA [Desulfolithobacter sp.]